MAFLVRVPLAEGFLNVHGSLTREARSGLFILWYGGSSGAFLEV